MYITGRPFSSSPRSTSLSSLCGSLEIVCLRIARLVLALMFAGTIAQQGFGQDAPSQSSSRNTTAAKARASSVLANQVRQIINTPGVSSAKKEKRIANAVRVAIVTATAYNEDRLDRLEVAIAMASAAAKAAPRYTEAISSAASFTPAVSRVEGGAGQLRAAAYAASQGKPAGRRRKIEPTEIAESPVPRPARRRRVEATDDVAAGVEPAENAPAATPRRSAPRVVAKSEPPVERAPVEVAANKNFDPATETHESYADGAYSGNTTVMEAGAEPTANSGGLVADRRFVFHATLDAGLRHDDNVFLSNGANQVSDDIISITPGVAFDFGENTLTHGSLSYSIDFSRYLQDSAPDARLNHGVADFGYANGILSVDGAASYNESFQNNRDIAGLTDRRLIRTQVTGLNLSAEENLTPKTSLGQGISYDRLSYKNDSFSGSKGLSVPLNAYYKITPKTDISLGVSFRKETVDKVSGSAKDRYYNVGLRGQFTPKLSGNISVGQRHRSAQNGQKESLLGFDGSLSYELTPKTSAVFAFNRDFSVSALRQSLHNSTYSLTLATTFTPQWEAAASVSYRTVDYGFSFDQAQPETPSSRRDTYYEGSLNVSYVWTSWLTTAFAYNFRNNNSTLTAAEFSNNVFSIVSSLRY